MATATRANLSAKEFELVLETEKKNLEVLDEDGLDELLTRVRRARTKYVKLHRTEVAAQVPAKGARGAASQAPRRSGDKAEIFEEALARVSTALAKAARASAAELKAERLAAAAGPKATPPATARRSSAAGKAAPVTASGKVGPRSPGQKKAAASSKAQGARRQAKRDAR